MDFSSGIFAIYILFLPNEFFAPLAILKAKLMKRLSLNKTSLVRLKDAILGGLIAVTFLGGTAGIS